jgi:membrane associated rhomboid family serine protease
MLTDSITNDIKHYFRYGNVVTKLILANVAVFLFFGLFYLCSYLFESTTWYDLITNKLKVPAAAHTLLYQPWSVFTYMFLHTGLGHVFFNMLWLYWFGEIFVLHIGDKRVLPLYILGGLSGAVIYMLAYNFIPVFKPQVDSSLMLGASASIFAIVFGAATLNPDYEIRLILLGNVRIKYIAVFSLLLDVINIPYGNAGGYIAHVGGAISGFLYIRGLQNGTDIFGWLDKLGNPFKRKSPLRTTYRNENYRKPIEKSNTKTEQQRVDEILDKIARSGYDSLNKEEREFLFHYSKK